MLRVHEFVSARKWRGKLARMKDTLDARYISTKKVQTQRQTNQEIPEKKLPSHITGHIFLFYLCYGVQRPAREQGCAE
jgi:hypothetical protein